MSVLELGKLACVSVNVWLDMRTGLGTYKGVNLYRKEGRML
jgi:hypothetical protein